MGFEGAHVSDVLAEVGEVAFGEAEGGFEFGSCGQDFRHFVREVDRHGGVASGTAQRHFAAFEGADDGIVADDFDVAIVG